MNSNQTENNELLRHEAAVLFITHHQPFKVVAETLKIPIGKIITWSNEGKWMELRAAPPKVPDPKIREAEILYVKHGLTFTEISEKIGVSMPTLSKWSKAGGWKELQPDFEIMGQYKAAAMYIEKGMGANEISMHLNVSEDIVKIWIYLHGWDAARLVSNSQNVVLDIVDAFCQHFKTLLPALSVEIEFAKKDYIKSIAPKI